MGKIFEILYELQTKKKLYVTCFETECSFIIVKQLLYFFIINLKNKIKWRVIVRKI